MADNIGINFGLAYARVTVGEADPVTGLGFGLGAGYNIDLAPNLTLFPQVGISYMKISSTMTVATVETDFSASKLALVIDAPVLYHFNNFFVGVGPAISMDLSSKAQAGDADAEDANKNTTYGLGTTIGGWF